jgi:hypothetical protein
MHPSQITLLACTVLVVAITGCARDELLDVSGRVSFDGTPVQDGTISFRPSDGAGPTAGGLVVDGHYALRVAPGTKRVEIQEYKHVGMQRAVESDPTSPIVPRTKAILPEKYNAKTTLTFDVRGSTDTADFDLRSD